jgi:hypothetical protein
LPAKAARLKAVEEQQALPGFWADPEAARASVQQLKILRNWLVPYDTLHRRLESALEMAQLLAAEPDESMSADLAREADELDTAAEAFELCKARKTRAMRS